MLSDFIIHSLYQAYTAITIAGYDYSYSGLISCVYAFKVVCYVFEHCSKATNNKTKYYGPV